MRRPVLVALLLACCLGPGCKAAPSTRSAADLVLVAGEPRCPKLGVVDGVGGSETRATASALDQATARGATHVRLEPAHPDLEDGMTIVVTCTMFKCPPSGEEFPPAGYE